jgi:hypothetical protein
MPRILIAGAGVAGSYLWRLLVLKKVVADSDIQVVDPGSKTRCGIAPCGFAVTGQFFPLCREVGLNPEKYVLRKLEVGYLGKVKLKVVGSALSIDKPAFIRDLLDGADVASSPSSLAFDRIIDATGTARAYIGKYESDLLAPCLQRKVEFATQPFWTESPHRAGYHWVIPLQGNLAHVGIGSTTYEADRMRKIIEEATQKAKIICSCHGYVRLTGPILPLARGKVWAVGESGGLVEPLSGCGIVPAMVSAKFLLENWDDPKSYEASVLREYGWFIKSHELVRKWRDANVLNFWDIGLLRKYAKFCDLELNLSNLVRVIIPNLVLMGLQLPSMVEVLRSFKRY